MTSCSSHADDAAPLELDGDGICSSSAWTFSDDDEELADSGGICSPSAWTLGDDVDDEELADGGGICSSSAWTLGDDVDEELVAAPAPWGDVDGGTLVNTMM
jgi:hypothetical protein